MKLVRLFVLFLFLFNLSACTECGGKSFIYGSCDISQNSQSSGVSFLANRSKRPYMTKQEDWKRKVDFSTLVGDSSGVEYYCYFMQASESGYENATKQSCTNPNEKYHLISWEKISDSNYRENFVFVVEAFNLETGKTDAIATYQLKDELSHIEKYIDCDFIPNTTSSFVSFLQSSSSANSNVCLKDGFQDTPVGSSISIGAASIKIYGREPEPNTSEKPPKIETYLSSGYFISSEKAGFEMHGVVLEATKAGMSGHVYTSYPIHLSFINVRGASNYAPSSFLTMNQESTQNDNFSTVDSVNLKLASVKDGIVLRGGKEDLSIKNFKMQIHEPVATKSLYGVHIGASSKVSIHQSTIDVLVSGHAVKMEGGSLHLSKNEFIQRVDNKQLFLIVDGIGGKEIDLAGNRYIRKDESVGTPDPIFQVTNSDGINFKHSSAEDGTSREWACFINDSIANFSNYFGVSNGASITSHPNVADIHAFQGNGIKDCTEIPEPEVISNNPDQWSADSYGFKGNGWAD